MSPDWGLGVVARVVSHSAIDPSYDLFRVAMQRYQVIGYDADDRRLFDMTIQAPNKVVAQMMVLANFTTAPLADRADEFVVCREGEKADERSKKPPRRYEKPRCAPGSSRRVAAAGLEGG
jgi:hypothetical protein